MQKKVYMAMSADFIHQGHLNIIKKARELGELTIGVISDKGVATYKRSPILNFQQRKDIIENIKGVHQVIEQLDLDYEPNLIKLKPDYVIHGDNWQTGPQSVMRKKVIDLLKTWDGELVEIPYTKNLDSMSLINQAQLQGITPNMRLSKLRTLLNQKNIIRIIEVHNGLTGLIAQTVHIRKDNEILEFDGMWESSLTDSTSKGKPDTSAVDFSSRFSTIDQILEVTTKPMIVDGDNGGLTEHFKFTVKTLERLGVSAVIIEDKTGIKRNSLFGTDVDQSQDSIEDFSFKISQGKKAQINKDFMIIARVESLILKKGMEDALKRAKSYVEAGADGIMIHSSSKEPTEILEFCHKFNQYNFNVPLVVVPSTYAQIYEEALIKAGVKIVIYANHLLRSAFPAMKKTAQSILEHGRCLEADQSHCMSIKEIISLIPE